LELATPLLAYVDPGSGLLIWQLLCSAVIGALFYVKKTRDLLFGALRKVLRREHSPDRKGLESAELTSAAETMTRRAD